MNTKEHSGFIQRLMANGDINYWDSEIEKAAEQDKNCVRVNILLLRGINRLKLLKFNLPNALFQGKNRDLCVTYLTASIYNEIVCDGAVNIVVFMENKNEERCLANVIEWELKRKYERMKIYGNFGDDIRIDNSMTFSYNFTKELQQNLVPLLGNEKQGSCIGVDVGGTNIKTVIIKSGNVVYSAIEEVHREGGGQVLKSQILLGILKAKVEAQKKRYNIKCLGLTFPAPIKKAKDRSFKIVRMTNFERYWKEANKGSSDFTEDYNALNGIVDDIRKQDIHYIEVMNDADAFGFNEIFHRISQGEGKGVDAILAP